MNRRLPVRVQFEHGGRLVGRAHVVVAVLLHRLGHLVLDPPQLLVVVGDVQLGQQQFFHAVRGRFRVQVLVVEHRWQHSRSGEQGRVGRRVRLGGVYGARHHQIGAAVGVAKFGAAVVAVGLELDVVARGQERGLALECAAQKRVVVVLVRLVEQGVGGRRRGGGRRRAGGADGRRRGRRLV